ncbi:hypothetical protein BLNAU_4208 [Blattamonas nauphoetae]|uniref:Uncharacterized protein n=1 Tax=Blattamonas nauphoetae TaxID=2049346 RepID=A0ABQ9YAN3_9EUKA|nr:hypothetical protein BLNAU_4208 [Blattamonas nauphoetae]
MDADGTFELTWNEYIRCCPADPMRVKQAIFSKFIVGTIINIHGTLIQWSPLKSTVEVKSRQPDVTMTFTVFYPKTSKLDSLTNNPNPERIFCASIEKLYANSMDVRLVDGQQNDLDIVIDSSTLDELFQITEPTDHDGLFHSFWTSQTLELTGQLYAKTNISTLKGFLSEYNLMEWTHNFMRAGKEDQEDQLSFVYNQRDSQELFRNVESIGPGVNVRVAFTPLFRQNDTHFCLLTNVWKLYRPPQPTPPFRNDPQGAPNFSQPNIHTAQPQPNRGGPPVNPGAQPQPQIHAAPPSSIAVQPTTIAQPPPTLMTNPQPSIAPGPQPGLPNPLSSQPPVFPPTNNYQNVPPQIQQSPSPAPPPQMNPVTPQPQQPQGGPPPVTQPKPVQVQPVVPPSDPTPTGQPDIVADTPEPIEQPAAGQVFICTLSQKPIVHKAKLAGDNPPIYYELENLRQFIAENGMNPTTFETCNAQSIIEVP